MNEFIVEDRVVSRPNAPKESDVGLVTRPEQERGFTLMECGEAVLKLKVSSRGAADQS
jgi:hypothetical protein